MFALQSRKGPVEPSSEGQNGLGAAGWLIRKLRRLRVQSAPSRYRLRPLGAAKVQSVSGLRFIALQRPLLADWVPADCMLRPHAKGLPLTPLSCSRYRGQKNRATPLVSEENHG